VCSAALSLRASENARVRQPLASLTVSGNTAGLEPHADLNADEVNVKQVLFSDAIEEYASFRLQPNSRALGPRLGPEMKNVLRASRQGEWELFEADGAQRVRVAGQELGEDEYALLLVPREGVSCEALPSGDAIVVLDLQLSDDLLAEGRARDVVRAVQQARKEADFHVSDRIRLALELPGEWRSAVEQFREYVCEQTLATQLELDTKVAPGDLSVHEATLGGEAIRVGVARDVAA
jgi:isoleucyl-tRNA synthetase